MYVWGRLAKMLATAHARGRCSPLDAGVMRFRCLPTDIDRNIHLNNARYLMLADVGRVDLFVRSGLLRMTRERGWAPMMGGVQSVYVREIRLWKTFEVRTTFETWVDSQIIGRHHFVLESGQTAALLYTTAGFYDFRNRRFVPIAEVVGVLGLDVEPRPPSEAERIFMDSHAGLRALAKAM